MISATDLAEQFNLTKHPRSWRGECPACSYSGNTFSVKAGKEGRAVLYCANGCSQDDLHQAVNARLGSDWKAPDKPTDADQDSDKQRKKDKARRLWQGSEPAVGSPVETYLAARGLAGLERSPALRFRGDTPHPEGGRWLGMVAEVVDHTGAFLGVHRTYLCRDGSAKANVEPNRASLGPIWGGAVRLDQVAPELVVGEGIESSASAGRLMNLPAWAALSAGNLARGLILPEEVRSAVIAADHDPRARNGHYPGQEAAEQAAARWSAEGRKVRIIIPDRPGTDFNDHLREHAV